MAKNGFAPVVLPTTSARGAASGGGQCRASATNAVMASCDNGPSWIDVKRAPAPRMESSACASG